MATKLRPKGDTWYFQPNTHCLAKWNAAEDGYLLEDQRGNFYELDASWKEVSFVVPAPPTRTEEPETAEPTKEELLIQVKFLEAASWAQPHHRQIASDLAVHRLALEALRLREQMAFSWGREMERRAEAAEAALSTLRGQIEGMRDKEQKLSEQEANWAENPTPFAGIDQSDNAIRKAHHRARTSTLSAIAKELAEILAFHAEKGRDDE